VSFRSTGGVDVNEFAKKFGGGGHARAAGALIEGSIDRVRHDVVAAAREFLRATDAAKPRRSTPRHSPKVDR
jgi:phosphoesterase RecJ-like protein